MPSRQVAPWSSRGLIDPVSDLHREMNRLFDDVFRGGTLADVRSGLHGPRIDVHEKDGELCVVADLPGVAKEDLDIQLVGDMLTISGETHEEQEQERRNYYVMERTSGRFQRTIQLPSSPPPDQVKASFENGTLRIRMPKGNGHSAHRIQLENEAGQQRNQQTAGQASGKAAGQAGGQAAPQKNH